MSSPSSPTQTSSAENKVKVRPAVKDINTSVLIKLIGFFVALVLVPILTYFYCLNSIFTDNPTYSAFAAAAMANVIVFAYVGVAYVEDLQEDNKEKTA
ncbi:hypothetical protein BJ684DRAFT_12056 [Piptocephalis cylindrospora]|uniref:Vacuolar ATPase assembly integral membrane protein VMA21 n=1 Tax=Piptocephalis cylindrospora TaxID=1907219 RepID=A0A4P9Y2I4_9FUNG|nr:hypothetical protein BJ684DRAFT_12056 [Piptocephalis cylindrospora]|eukprot:RKP12050.1 hypothetical protein BJ684DRAFT_12056 [Piptocephalis cylindrospora]